MAESKYNVKAVLAPCPGYTDQPMLDSLRVRLVARLLELPEERLLELEQFLSRTPSAPAALADEKYWPHAPLHRLSDHGTFLVTASTYQKEHHFRGAARLDYLETKLLAAAKEAGWQLEAWAVFANHYHFVAQASAKAERFSDWIGRLHRETSEHVNTLDGTPGRKTWHNYRETELTYETSYLARLSYVHQNAVKHGLVQQANQYRWCSAAWFERTATRAQVRTIYRFKTDQVKIEDDFDPV
jgi:putative transposase